MVNPDIYRGKLLLENQKSSSKEKVFLFSTVQEFIS